MMLYHCNPGFPLISPAATIHADVLKTIPCDPAAEAGVDSWMTCHAPTADYTEQVFRHRLNPVKTADRELGVVTIRNPEAGLALKITYSHDTLPHLFQWKQMGQGAYAMGIEPANSTAIEGRQTARERDDLPILRPGESCSYQLTFEVQDLN
jgi:hypothetical protein